MKALSMHPLYACQICAKIKRVEHRTWKTDYRGPLVICSSQFNDGKDCPRGYALCVVDLYDIVKTKSGYSWKLRDVVLIKPFPVKGKLHLFEVPDEKLSRLVYTDDQSPLDFEDAYEYWLSMGICQAPPEE
jgi:hypothetical protein